MPGAWLSTVLVAALPAAAGASIIIIICLAYHMQKGRGAKDKGIGQISILWPNIFNEKSEENKTKKVKNNSSHSNNSSNTLDSSIKKSSKIANIWRNNYPVKNFKWSENPSLVAEAVEHGWATFAFTFANMDAPLPPKLWESCASFSSLPASVVDNNKLAQPELMWEVCGASSDYMQRICLNPSLTNPNKRELHLNGLISTVQTLQTTLPLPGPPLGPLSFPQEGYYEITVLGLIDHHDSLAELSQYTSFNENEHSHLISGPCASASLCGTYGASDIATSVEPVVSRRPSSFSISIGINDLSKGGSNTENAAAQGGGGDVHSTEDNADTPALQSAANEQQICAIGLAARSAPPFRLPGSDMASIGFFSNGRVFLNGKEQSKPQGWQRRVWGPTTESPAPVTVGCGFDPGARRLFFTLNGEMVEEIPLPDETCSDKSMEFTAYPLFPTIGANYNVTVTANFGQAAFEYAAANATRVPDPCFRRPPAGAAKAAGEDSADLFSMGRIDSQWLAGLGGGTAVSYASPARGNRAPPPPPSSTSTSSSEPVNVPASEGVDSDLFEITLQP